MMKYPVLVGAALAVLFAVPLATRAESGDVGLSVDCCEPPARWASRHDVRDARYTITTEKGDAMMLLTDAVVAVQLSDRVIHKLDRKLKQEQKEEEDNLLARTIKSAVLGGVRTMLDHAAEVPVRKLRDVEYTNGRLIFTTVDGERVFDKIEVRHRDVMTDFSDSDARAFVREFRRWKARQRQG